ncbi:hypothetical protein GGR42_002767 [Saonia flava]|uniref:Lipocalin-like domain-containing protein n=1 Tax=Saonia flava TaxID=523696 RepID=A0A846QTI4_9FLAO|nr:hypothetical protein [Saonia flava]NJB72276.1 hypothetical protein [Saonia flava]
MRPFSLLLLILILTGCSQKKITHEDLTHLNGYWEIDTVTFPDGTTKEYKVNTSVDYIEINSLKGYRKKMHPKFDGTFSTSNDAEQFTILETKDGFIMFYKTNLSDWEEQIVDVSQNHFSVKNKENVTYIYKRFLPINIEK